MIALVSQQIMLMRQEIIEHWDLRNYAHMRGNNAQIP